jgi:hypothetical protein
LAIVFVQMWLRWTLPRPRIDQVLYACVKVLLPLACVLLLGAALWQLFVPELAIYPQVTGDFAAYNPWNYFNPWNFAEWIRRGATATLVTEIILTLIGVAGSMGVVAWVFYAFALDAGRKHKQRLTDPIAIDKVPENLVKA